MQTDEALKFVEQAQKLLPEGDKNIEGYDRFLKGAKNAKGMLTTKERELRLQMDAINAANHAAFTLFRLGLLSDELEKDYRALKGADKATEEYQAAYDERNKADEELREQVKKAQEAQKDMDIFVQVIGGASVEEAEARLDAYRQAGGK